MARKVNDNDTPAVVADTFIQFAALIALVIVIFVDSKDTQTSFEQIELLLAGIAAARPAKDVIDKIKNKKER